MKFIRINDVINKVGLGRSTIYELISAGEFPKRVKLYRQAVAWLESDIDEWMLQKLAERDDESC